MAVKPRWVRTVDGIWPESLEIFPASVRLGSLWARSFTVAAYPGVVEPNWFAPLLQLAFPMTLAVYSSPLATAEAMQHLHKRLLFHRGLQQAAKKLGYLADPEQEAAIEDAERLRKEMTRGDMKLLETALCITIWAESAEMLEERSAQLMSLASGMMVLLRGMRYQQEVGLSRTLGWQDPPPLRREMDSAAWAMLFPYASAEVIHPGGQLWGVNPQNRSLVMINRFHLASPHSITIAWSGAGKSFFAKLEALRASYHGLPVYILDPEGEYRQLDQMGAKIWSIGAASSPAFPYDPLQLPHALNPEELDRQLDFLLRFLIRLLPEEQDAIKKEIPPILWKWCRPDSSPQKEAATFDLTALNRPSGQVMDILARDCPQLAERLQPAVQRWRLLTGDVSSSSAAAVSSNRQQVFDLSRLTERMKNVAYFALVEWIMRQVDRTGQRLVIFDEAWHLLNDPEIAVYLEELFRRARKRGTALHLITQDIGDFTRSRSAEVCLRNAPTILLLRQHPESVQEVARLLRLNPGEIQVITQAQRGEGLLMVAEDHVPLHIVASDAE
ncbi:MAG: DUF87 domain-containing protein, partial [Firmicutes bacterium]|nr:DUF87 domain-containing protein [Bacillota bacterium]